MWYRHWCQPSASASVKALCRFILAVAKIQPSMVGEVGSVLSFSVSTPGPAYFGVICSLIKGKRGETIRQSDGLLLLCVSLTGPLSEASSPSVVVCPMSLQSTYGILEQNAS